MLADARARLLQSGPLRRAVRWLAILADPAVRRWVARRSLAVARALIVMVSVSVALAAGAFAASTLYGQYGAPRLQTSTAAWIDRTATYGRTDCRQCHAAEALAEGSARHADLICETCHVPVVAHPGTIQGVVQALPAPTSAMCGTCHSRATGRPIAFPQVALSQHYAGADCLRCHDPHTSAAASPPEIPHPLANLPACVTCHAPGGLKRFPAGHQPAADTICLTCHRPGVGDPAAIGR
jgi:hypothetical protein